MAKKWAKPDLGSDVPFWFSGDDCPTPGKRTWETKKDAKTVLSRWKVSNSKGRLRPYKCPGCGGYHVGSQIYDRGTSREIALRKLGVADGHVDTP